MKVVVHPERCKGCLLCVENCPAHVFRLSTSFNQSGYHFVEPQLQQNCTGCRRCVIICPDVAIELYQEGKKKILTKGEE